MYTDFDGHHSGGSSFDMYMMFGLSNKMWAIPTGTRSALKKKKSQYMVSHLELGSDPPIGSNRESGCDKFVSELRFRHFWKSLRLRMYQHSKVLA